MHHLKFAYILFFSFLSLGIVAAQESDKAAQMYQNLAYKEAIKLYESKEELSVEDMERIANGYRLNHDTENAALWFEQIVERSDNPINYLYFAQALQSNGDYLSAKKYFLHYNQLIGNPSNDQRGNHLAEAIDRMNDWNKEEEVVLKQEASINSENLDFSPAFYNDGIVYVSSRKLSNDKKYKWTDDHFMNLFYAPANKEGVLNSVQSFSKMINSKYHEGPVAFNKSFNRIFFTRNDHLNGKVNTNKKGVMKLGIFTALRDGDNWTEPKAIDFNTKEYEECHPSLSADGKYLYFASDREGGNGGMDIYRSDFKDGKWGDPVNLGPEINTPGNDVFPFIHDDGTLYFASDGWGGMGGLDIFYSKKDTVDQWTTAANMGLPYNSRKDDFGFILNVLGTEGYLSSSRAGGRGKDDIYSFKRGTAAVEQPRPKVELINMDFNNKIQANDLYLVKTKQNGAEASKDRILQELLEIKAKITDQSNMPRQKELIEIAAGDKEYVLVLMEKEGNHKAAEKPGNPINRTLNTFAEAIEKKRIVIGETFELKGIYYDFNKYDINKKAARELDLLVHIMKEHLDLTIELSAHTDSRGRTRYNQWLSRKRAKRAVQYIIDRGISPDRIMARGYGETKLKNKCEDNVDCEETDHQVNRRTEIKIVKM